MIMLCLTVMSRFASSLGFLCKQQKIFANFEIMVGFKDYNFDKCCDVWPQSMYMTMLCLMVMG